MALFFMWIITFVHSPGVLASDELPISNRGYFSLFEDTNHSITIESHGILVYKPVLNHTHEGGFTYMANDGSTIITVTISPHYRSPIADAGTNLTVYEGSPVFLIGNKSRNLDTNTIEYKWQQMNGSGVKLINNNTATASFVAPDAGSEGLRLLFKLDVRDVRNMSDRDYVTVKVEPLDMKLEVGLGLKFAGFIQSIIERISIPKLVMFSIDSSSSMRENDPFNLRLKNIKPLIDSLDPRTDRAAVLGWDKSSDTTSNLTSNFTGLKDRVDEIDSEGNTNINSALSDAINIFDTNPSDGPFSKAIIILTDGKGTYTYSGEQDSLVDQARKKGYRIFSIGLNIDSGSIQEDRLQDMANGTGGQYFSSPSKGNLQMVLENITQYNRIARLVQ
jgi:hypothetical protein